MADPPKEDNDEFWNELGTWITSKPENRKKVIDLFVADNVAPAPAPNDPPKDPSDPPAPKKKGGWFAND